MISISCLGTLPRSSQVASKSMTTSWSVPVNISVLTFASDPRWSQPKASSGIMESTQASVVIGFGDAGRHIFGVHERAEHICDLHVGDDITFVYPVTGAAFASFFAVKRLCTHPRAQRLARWFMRFRPKREPDDG